MPYRTIDLCSGIGGIRRGFEMTGHFENVLSAEIDKYACLTYEHLFGENPYNDITSEEFKLQVEQTDYDVLLAGFPCQSFSAVGNKEGFDDPDKGVIFNHIADIIRRTRPRAVFLENVENLVRHDDKKTFFTILNKLENELNYKIVGLEYTDNGSFIVNNRNFIRNSKNFGVPQNRPRTYIIAFNRDIYDDAILNELPNLPESNDEEIYEDLNQLLEFGADRKYYMSSGYLNTLIAHKQRQKNNGYGFGFKIVNEEGIAHPIANTIMATGGSGKERNLVIDIQDGIAGTVYPTKHTPLNNRCIRVMTPREWGKLQGFINYGFINNGEDSFEFPKEVSMQQQYKQFGNSVTIPLIKTMAEYIYNCFGELNDDNYHNWAYKMLFTLFKWCHVMDSII